MKKINIRTDKELNFENDEILVMHNGLEWIDIHGNGAFTQHTDLTDDYGMIKFAAHIDEIMRLNKGEVITDDEAKEIIESSGEASEFAYELFWLEK